MHFHVSCRHPMLPSMFFGVGVLGGCRQEIVSVFFACLPTSNTLPSTSPSHRFNNLRRTAPREE